MGEQSRFLRLLISQQTMALKVASQNVQGLFQKEVSTSLKVLAFRRVFLALRRSTKLFVHSQGERCNSPIEQRRLLERKGFELKESTQSGL